MSKHTQGPWEAKKSAKDHWVVYGGGEPLADIVPWSDPVDEADARLIAAAPELLEALHDLTALYAASPGANPHFVEKGRAAIAKAKGEA